VFDIAQLKKFVLTHFPNFYVNLTQDEYVRK